MLFYLVNFALAAYVAANCGGPLHWAAWSIAAIWAAVIWSIVKRIAETREANSDKA